MGCATASSLKYSVPDFEDQKLFIVFVKGQHLLIKDVDENETRIFNSNELLKIYKESQNSPVRILIDRSKMTRARAASVSNAARRLGIKWSYLK